MEIMVLMIGKSNEGFISMGIEEYLKRLNHYVKTSLKIIPDLKERKNLSTIQVKDKEAALILSQIPNSSYIVLLDENGTSLSSYEFSTFLQKQFNTGIKTLVFIIGGAFGVSELIKKKANIYVSFSKMTFTHQFIRIMLIEQIYRAMTILRNEPYHNE
jgi:23S rRNA (pseudouridine1915-N3)-methyltransferase